MARARAQEFQREFAACSRVRRALAIWKDAARREMPGSNQQHNARPGIPAARWAVRDTHSEKNEGPQVAIFTPRSQMLEHTWIHFARECVIYIWMEGASEWIGPDEIRVALEKTPSDVLH